MPRRHNILIFDEDTILGVGLRVLLTEQADLHVVSDAGGPDDIIARIARLAPDLLITDLRITDLRIRSAMCAEDIASVKRSHPRTRILLVTQHKSEESIRAAFGAGASGYVLKDATNAELLTAVRSVLDGKVYLSPSLSDDVINAFLFNGRSPETGPDLAALTQREREILKMVAEGHTNRYVATQLNLSIKTVEKHRSNLMKKLNIHNISALTSFALGQGLIHAAD